MTREDLLDLMGEVDENEAAKARTARPVRFPLRFLATAAACLCVGAVGLFGLNRLGLLPGLGAAGGGGGAGDTYMSYAGPVFPLTVLEENSGLTAQRLLNFDFSLYAPEVEAQGRLASLVTDRYLLENPGAEDKTVTLCYPFAASLGSGLEEVPALTVNGTAAQTRLHIGPGSGNYLPAAGSDRQGETLNLAILSGWEDYQALMEAGSRDWAFAPLTLPDTPVTVYELSGLYCESSQKNASLMLEYDLDMKKTTVLSYGFNAFRFETAETGGTAGTAQRSCGIPTPGQPDYGESVYLIVVGEDISAPQLTAWSHAGGSGKQPLTDAGATLTRYESTLGEMLLRIAGQYRSGADTILYGDGGSTILSLCSESDFAALCARLLLGYGTLAGDGMDRYDVGMLEEICADTRSIDRVLYLTAEITVPAGQTVEVTAAMKKPASIDFHGKNKYRNGYDLVTTLGSDLTFTGQEASLSGWEYIELLRQDFGFDPEQGITRVPLDTARPHYAMDVRRKAAD